MSQTSSPLNLASLSEEPGMPAVTTSAGAFFAEAAIVCLETCGHKNGVLLSVEGVKKKTYQLEWPTLSEQMRRTHADLQDATEYGAHAIALVLSRQLTPYRAVMRSWKGTGFDYWLGSETDTQLFCARIEISGILEGSHRQIIVRVNEKKEQIARYGQSDIPAFVCVVEFSIPKSHFVTA